MSERRSLGRLAQEPLYNTRAVVQMTGVPADTFRAWERRYGLPRPFRTATNQRLYSEQDAGVITWLRDRTREGMTISQAIQRLRFEFPELFITTPPVEQLPPDQKPNPGSQPEQLHQRLIGAMVAFDTRSAERVIDDALARFSVEEFCIRIVEPVLYEIGVRWSRNELSVAVEHFATRLLFRRLSALFALVSPVNGRGSIVAACSPGEEHEVGLLVLAIFLARRGWHVVYLGASVPVDDLVSATRGILPDLVCLSASTTYTARQAVDIGRTLRSAINPPPLVALGGRAFVNGVPQPAETGLYSLTGNAAAVADQIGELIERHQVTG